MDSSFRGDAKHRTRNLEIPGLVLTRHPGMTEYGLLRRFAPRNDDGHGKRKWQKQPQQGVPPPVNACAEKSRSRSMCPRAGPGMIIRPRAGAAYATYVGSWRKRLRITRGKAAIARFEDKAAKTVRSFCAHCATPLFYDHAP